MPLVLTASTNPGTATWTELSSLVSSSFVILRPAGPADPTANVYTTFATAFTAANALATASGGRVSILVDVPVAFDSITIPAGTYDFLGLINITAYSNIPYTLETEPDTYFTGFQLGVSFCELYHNGTDPLVTITDGEPYYQIGPYAGLITNSSGSIYHVTVFTLLYFLTGSYTLIAGTESVITAIETIGVYLGPDVNIETNNIGTADATKILNIRYESPGVYTSQNTSWAGTIVYGGAFPIPSYAVGGLVVNTPESLAQNVPQRTVFGVITLAATVANAASINWQVETGYLTGVYTTVLSFTQAVNDTTARTYSYSFVVPGGRRYRFTRGGLAGTTETVTLYNYVDSQA